MVLGGGVALTGCAGVQPALVAPAQQTLKGELSYRARIALPPDAVAVVEVRDTQTDKVVRDVRLPLQGKQVPVPFALTLDRLAAGGTYALRGGIEQQGRLAWLSEPVAVTPGSTDVGVLQLVQQPQQQAFASKLQCGDKQISVGFSGDAMTLQAGRSQFALTQVRTASGAKYAANDDPQTWFWSKGQGGMLQLHGKSYPECVPVKDAGATPGASALQGAEWQVAGGKRPSTLNFAADGRISGFAGCNRYTGQYAIDGSVLRIDKVATTRMACGAAPTKQERGFLKALARVNGFAVAADGTLTLKAGEQAVLRARRPS
ncbi:hypothetical protein BJP62_07745 [Jeongeupia sp. USM3]|nr:hypothetical protein BJP62_07745 [Jeongeupia sp. USM3]